MAATKGGIHLTQVTARCSMRPRRGLPSRSETRAVGSGRELKQTSTHRSEDRAPPGRTVPAPGLHHHEHGLAEPFAAAVRQQTRHGEQWIKEGKPATSWTRRSCHRFAPTKRGYRCGTWLRSRPQECTMDRTGAQIGNPGWSVSHQALKSSGRGASSRGISPRRIKTCHRTRLQRHAGTDSGSLSFVSVYY